MMQPPATHSTPRSSLFLAAFASLALLGCSPGHLAGTNDAALQYVVENDAAGPQVGAALAATEVKARLVAAQVGSDVTATDDHQVRVIVDADIAGAVDQLLQWRGGLTVYRVETGAVLSPPDPSALRPMSEMTANGSLDRWWEGSAEPVGRAVREAKLDAGHSAFAERMANGQSRTRIVSLPALAESWESHPGFSSIESAMHGRALTFALEPSTRDAIVKERASHTGLRVAFARGSNLLITMSADDALANPLLISFGDDLSAYSRAARTKELLLSPILPTLRRISASQEPPRWGLAAACALLPFVLSFGWLFFVRRFDRARPEPLWLVIATFALGGLAIAPAAVAEVGLASLTPWLDPSLATLGGQPWALPIAILVFSLAVGGVEEGSKFLAAWSLPRHRRDFDEPVDGIVYGRAAALGFAAVENIKYFAIGRMSGAVIALRAFMTVPAHMFFGAIWGYGMGRALVSRRTRVVAYLAAAAVAHGTFDAVLSTDGMQLVATVLVLVLGFAFIEMLRRALRHGAVPPRLPSDSDGSPPYGTPAPQHAALGNTSALAPPRSSGGAPSG